MKRLAVVLCLLVAPLARGQDATAPRELRLARDGVEVTITIHSQLHTIVVANVNAEPITRFHVGGTNIYNHTPPEGWTVDEDGEGFTSAVDHPRHAIFPGASATFSYRVSSTGAMLGGVPLELGFHDGAPVRLDGVWGAVAPSGSVLATIVITLVVLGVLHAWVVERRSRQSTSG